MPERHPPIDHLGASLADLEKLIAERRLPPVERWNPRHCGESGMRIASDGTWYHEGRPITRPEMVRLFSSVLRREEDGRHVLVTPVEKLDIEVERTPFRAVEMKSEKEGSERRIAFRLNTGEALVLGPRHPLVMVKTSEGPSPRVEVRNGLEAELSRPLYYELADIALAEGASPPGVWSNGMFFALDDGE
ncbi:MAG TPA: DUF1285 domain-containing protein [Sphingomicrobium sp.]|nr:DUF1285 domain-containing protein [Sphingomicrobium sp.]